MLTYSHSLENTVDRESEDDQEIPDGRKDVLLSGEAAQRLPVLLLGLLLDRKSHVIRQAGIEAVVRVSCI